METPHSTSASSNRRRDDIAHAGSSSSKREHHSKETKTLRSHQPDLTVFVGTEKKRYDCYSQILASKSGYIDTALATPMKEQETMTMTFEDIEPSDWELVMGITKPRNWQLLNEMHLLSLLPLCDKYDFHDAIDSIDEMLSKKVDFNICPKKMPLSDLDLQLDVVGAACRYHLELTQPPGIALVDKLFNDCDARLGLKEHHIQAIVPLMETNEPIWTKVCCFMSLESKNEEKVEIMESKLFPKLLLTRFREMALEARVKQQTNNMRRGSYGRLPSKDYDDKDESRPTVPRRRRRGISA